MKALFALLILTICLVVMPPGKTKASSIDHQVSFVANFNPLPAPAVVTAQEKGGDLLVMQYSNPACDQFAYVQQPAVMKQEKFGCTSPKRSFEIILYNSQGLRKSKHPPTNTKVMQNKNQVAVYRTKIGSATAI